MDAPTHRRRSRLLLALAATGLVGVAGPASASSGDGPVARFSVGVGAAKLGEDYFAKLTIGGQVRTPAFELTQPGRWFAEAQSTALRVGLYAPVSLRVYDADPEGGGVVRKQEWDEPGEWLRVVRWVELGRPYDNVRLRAGELVDQSLGHGTIVRSFHNSLDLDHARWGLAGELNAIQGGFEGLLDDVVDPHLVAARVHVRPWAFDIRPGAADAVTFGLSVAADLDAPRRLVTDASGRYLADDEGNFKVATSNATAILGLDTEYPILRGSAWTLTPYSDINWHAGYGAGWHVGSFAGWSGPARLELDARAEVSLAGSDYLPAYFGALYSVERFAYRSVGDSVQRFPKLQWLRGADEEVRLGQSSEIGARWGDSIEARLGYANEFGSPTGVFSARLTVTPGSFGRFGVFFARSGIGDAGELVALDDALIVGEARVQVTSLLYVAAQASRRWQLDEDGRYQPADDYTVGTGLSFGF